MVRCAKFRLVIVRIFNLTNPLLKEDAWTTDLPAIT